MRNILKFMKNSKEKCLTKTIIILIICTVASCADYSSSIFITVKLKEQIGHAVEIKASDLINNIHYVPLETSKESLVGEIIKIIPTNNHFFISDDFNTLSVWTKEGKYINHIGRRGQGPGEYITLSDFDISTDNEIVYILDESKSQIHLYSFKNDYVKSIKINKLISNIMKTPFGIICYQDPLVMINKYGEQIPTLVLLNDNGEEIGILHQRNVSTKFMPPFTHPAILKKHNNSFYYYPPFQDTIYSIQADTITPEFVIDKGKYSISISEIESLEQMRRAYQTGIVVQNFEINSHYLILHCQRNNELELYIYDILKGQLINISGEDFSSTIVNDIDHSFNIFPICLFNNQIIEIKNAHEIDNVPTDIQPDDNPILRVSSCK